jgi:hypothetical protein
MRIISARDIAPVVVAIVAVIMAVGAFAASVAVRKAEVSAGNTVLVTSYKNWGPNCTPAQNPPIRIITPPSGGTLDLRAGDYQVAGEAPQAGASDCRGRTLPGVGIYYTARPDFRGEDRFTYTVDIGVSKPVKVQYEAIVTVR